MNEKIPSRKSNYNVHGTCMQTKLATAQLF